MRILLTGANGLLGRCLHRALGAGGAHEVVGTCHTRAAPDLRPVELTDPDAVSALLGEGGFTHIVHAAAWRDPERCLQDPAGACAVNAGAVELLARGANRTGARLVQVSTDYVFDGEAPPFAETDAPNPVNVYGRSKLAGEVAARTAERHLVLRIPALYRLDLTDPRNAAAGAARRLRAGETLVADDRIARYYTLADEVADAVRFLLEAGAEGVLHLSASGRTTKAGFCRLLAAALGLDPDRVRADTEPPTGDRRPRDSHLATDAYARLNGPAFTPAPEALARLAPDAPGLE
jgi:dTDP-4-dehydrorhamnose reductase